MLEVTPAERTKLLKRLAEALPTTKAPHAPPARRSDPVAALEAQLLPTLGGGPEELRALAADRAARARAAFLEERIDPGRLFLVQGGERVAKQRGRASTSP